MPVDPYLQYNADLNFDPNRFADELIAGSDVSDQEKEILRSVFAKTAPKLRNHVALRSEAQRTMDKARDAIAAAEEVRRKNFEWAEQNRGALEAFAAGGAGSGGTQRQPTVTAPSGEALTRADVDRLLQGVKEEFSTALAQQDNAYVGVITDTMMLSNRWHKLFPGDDFNFEELQQFAITNKLPLKLAFDKYIEPKLETKRAADLKKIEDEAYQRGLMEGRSQREADPSYGEEGGDLGTVFKDRLLGRRTQSLKDDAGNEITGEDAFVRNWNATHGFTQKPANSH